MFLSFNFKTCCMTDNYIYSSVYINKKNIDIEHWPIFGTYTLPGGWIKHVVPLKRRKKIVQPPRQSIQAYASAYSFGFRDPGTRSVTHHQHTRHYTATTLPLHRASSPNGVKCSLRLRHTPANSRIGSTPAIVDGLFTHFSSRNVCCFFF